MQPFLRCSLAAVVLALIGSGLAVTAKPAQAQAPVDDFVARCLAAPDNAYLATTRFSRPVSVRAMSPDQSDEAPAVGAFYDTSDDSGHISLATAGQVGATYGLAFHSGGETLYVGAYHKRGTQFGPMGPGAIYAINLRSGDVGYFADVPNAGADTHDPTNDYFPDLTARADAGKTSLGDLDLNEAGTELTVVNLNDRRLYRFSVPDGALIASFPHGAADEEWSADARPFGLGFNGGKLFHGVIRTAQSSQNPDELQAIVYESEPDGSQMREVASTGLRYARGMIWPGEGEAIWQPWSDAPGTVFPGKGRFPMPIFADIDFAENGSQMLIGLRDRFGDQTFYITPPDAPPEGEYQYSVPAGDILPARPEGDQWRIQVSPEHFTGDFGPDPTGAHDETSFGGLAVLPDGETVAMTANSPTELESAGAVWLGVASGDDNGREKILSFGEGNNFGGANGLGDLEALCESQQQSTETPTATQPTTTTATSQPTVTTPPTQPSTPLPTIRPTGLPSSTLPPGVTPPSRPDEDREATSVPGVATTPELPGLPQTGLGPTNAEAGRGAGLLILLALGSLAVAVALWWRQKRSSAA